MPEISSPKPVILTPQHVSEWVESFSEPKIKRTQGRQEVYPELVEIQILRHKASPVIAQARTRDLSEGGIGLTSREPIKIDEMVELKFHYEGTCYTVCASVVHCTQTIGGYKVGLRFVFEEE